MTPTRKKNLSHTPSSNPSPKYGDKDPAVVGESKEVMVERAGEQQRAQQDGQESEGEMKSWTRVELAVAAERGR